MMTQASIYFLFRSDDMLVPKQGSDFFLPNFLMFKFNSSMPTKAGPIFQCWQRKAFIPYLKTSRLFPTPTFTICLVASFHHSQEMVLLQGAKTSFLFFWVASKKPKSNHMLQSYPYSSLLQPLNMEMLQLFKKTPAVSLLDRESSLQVPPNLNFKRPHIGALPLLYYVNGIQKAQIEEEFL